MREMTLKCLPILAPILELSVMDTKLKKVLERSLQDPVPAIRTNATVCLGLLATKFTKSKITQLCLPSFTRALRDNFPINRERALHSIKSTLDLYTTMELGTKILPHVSAVSGGGGDGGDGGSGVFSCCSRVVLLYLPDVQIFFSLLFSFLLFSFPHLLHFLLQTLVDPLYNVRQTGFACAAAIHEKLRVASDEQEKVDAAKREEVRVLYLLVFFVSSSLTDLLTHTFVLFIIFMLFFVNIFVNIAAQAADEHGE